MLSQTVEYSLRAVVWLAQQPGLPATTQQIAGATKVPPDYLSKIMLTLGRSGIVTARRGRNGGFALAHPPTKLTVLHVINAVEPVQRIKTCPLGLASHGANLCPLHRRLDDAMASMEQAFATSTVADLLGEPSHSHPLCEAACA